VAHPEPRTETSVSAWAMEGRAGAKFSVDRSLRQHLDFGADPHVGFDAVWMATTELGYLDRSLWEDAGTVEGGPWWAITSSHGATVLHARFVARGGVVYSNHGKGVVSPTRYDFEGFGRFTGEASVRTPFWAGTTLGLRLFAGGYTGATTPGRGSTFLYEGGLGVVTRHQLGDLDWTLRFEVPLVVAPFQFAADSVSGKGRLAWRWQVSLSPSF